MNSNQTESSTVITTLLQDRKLGEILMDEGLVTESQLQEVYLKQASGDSYLPIGQLLVNHKIITQKQLNYILDRYWKRARLGDIMVRSGAITKELLEVALEGQKKTGLRLGEQLVKQNLIPEKKMRQIH